MKYLRKLYISNVNFMHEKDSHRMELDIRAGITEADMDRNHLGGMLASNSANPFLICDEPGDREMVVMVRKDRTGHYGVSVLRKGKGESEEWMGVDDDLELHEVLQRHMDGMDKEQSK